MERIVGPRSGKSLPGRDPAGRFGRGTRWPENGYGGRKRSRFLPPYFFVFRLSFPSPVGMPDVGVSMRGRVEKRIGRRSELCGFRFGTDGTDGTRARPAGAFGAGKSFACRGVMAVYAGRWVKAVFSEAVPCAVENREVRFLSPLHAQFFAACVRIVLSSNDPESLSAIEADGFPVFCIDIQPEAFVQGPGLFEQASADALALTIGIDEQGGDEISDQGYETRQAPGRFILMDESAGRRQIASAHGVRLFFPIGSVDERMSRNGAAQPDVQHGVRVLRFERADHGQGIKEEGIR